MSKINRYHTELFVEVSRQAPRDARRRRLAPRPHDHSVRRRHLQQHQALGRQPAGAADRRRRGTTPGWPAPAIYRPTLDGESAGHTAWTSSMFRSRRSVAARASFRSIRCPASERRYGERRDDNDASSLRATMPRNCRTGRPAIGAAEADLRLVDAARQADVAELRIAAEARRDPRRAPRRMAAPRCTGRPTGTISSRGRPVDCAPAPTSTQRTILARHRSGPPR